MGVTDTTSEESGGVRQSLREFFEFERYDTDLGLSLIHI